mgnify:FL=1|jgi:DNA modification methylase
MLSCNVLDQYVSDRVSLYNGDSIEILRGLPDGSVHYSIFSPPFSSLYTYSNSDRDMGNSSGDDEFYTHFGYLITELARVIMPGRLVSVHCMDIPRMKSRDGVIGIKDFSGEIIRAFESAGFIYHSRVVVFKDPLVEATRTKALGLMHKQLCKDSAMCRMGLPDYVLTFRKPGDNPEPVTHPDGLDRFYGDNEPEGRKIIRPDPDPDLVDAKQKYNTEPVYSHQVWRRYASPVWMDIRQSNTLNRAAARDDKDERHICPLQLDLIARCLELWTNPNDIVLDPFAGIGSVPVVALQMGRRALGFELKASYYQQMLINCKQEEDKK